MIPAEQNGRFVAKMKVVLDVHNGTFKPRYPDVCTDKTSKHLIASIKVALPNVRVDQALVFGPAQKCYALSESCFENRGGDITSRSKGHGP